MLNLIKNIALVLDDKQSFLCLENYEEDNTTELTTDIKTYITLANFVIKDIAANFHCYISKEKMLSSQNCTLNLESLAHKPCKIKAVKNFFGKKISFSVLTDKLVVPTSQEQYEIEYSYYPEDFEVDDTLLLPLGLNAKTICYGVVYEYFTLKMAFAEAAIWEQKYKVGLKILQKSYCDRLLFFRGW